LTVRSSKPKALTIACSGQPLASNTSYAHHRFRVRAQPIEDRALGYSKRVAADLALTALFLLAVNGDIAFIGLTSSRTVDIGAK
jgi:hypothetical protein